MQVDLFISIHRNSFPADNEVEGVESLIYDLSGLKYKMAQDINEQLEGVGFVNLGVKARPDLVVLKRTKMPAILVEAGFLNSDTDNRLFDDNFEDIAQAIADGILDTLESNGLIKEEKFRCTGCRWVCSGISGMRTGCRMNFWSRSIRCTLTGPARITESM